MTFRDLVAQIKLCFSPIQLDSYPDEFGFTENSTEPVSQVGYATNLSPESATKAVEAGVDVLLTHHDAWDFLYELRESTLALLKRSGISHAFVHLPLDAASFGTAATLAELLGLSIHEEFARYEGLSCGRVCNASRAETLDELASRLRSVTRAGVRIFRFGSESPKRIGITTGGGNLTDVLREAANLGCDTYITGEMGLYTAQYARHRGMNLLIGTHTHTELPGVASLCGMLANRTGLPFLPIPEEDIETGAPAAVITRPTAS